MEGLNPTQRIWLAEVPQYTSKAMFTGYLMEHGSTIGKEEILKFSILSIKIHLLSVPAFRIISPASKTRGAVTANYQSMFISISLLYSDKSTVYRTAPTITIIPTAVPGAPHLLVFASISHPGVH